MVESQNIQLNELMKLRERERQELKGDSSPKEREQNIRKQCEAALDL